MKSLVSSLAFIAVFASQAGALALTITPTNDATTLVNALLGGGSAITVTSVGYVGAADAAGTYTAGPQSIADGAILTSGAASIAMPPDDSSSSGQNNSLAGDPLCDQLIPGYTSYDAVRLSITFDLAPGFDGISFQSIFGSEEYQEYVGSSFNDVYGVYLNGQQIAFDANGNPITINGPFFAGGSVVIAPATQTEYDGSTGLLTTLAPLAGGTTGNVLQIVICDGGDYVLDSGVFFAGLSGCIGANCSGTVPCEDIDNDGDGADSCIDCDDTNPAAHPGATEVCDGADNDCDQQVDEGGVCAPTCVTIQRGLVGDVADTFIASNAWFEVDRPNKNYGANTRFLVGDVYGGQRKSLLRFDLGSIPASATVTSASVTLAQVDGGGGSTRAHRITGAWSEETVTWSNFGGAFDAAVVTTFANNGPGAFGSVAFDLTALAQGWVDGSVSNHGVLLEQDLVSYTSYASSESASAGARPRIEVCYTP